jgi:hypothetical protein
MTQLRDLFNDLVEKRLWPLALLLVGALVAVPLVLAKSAPSGSGSSETPAAAVAATPAAGAPVPGEPVVSLAQGEPPSAPLRGHAKDPFHQQHVQAPTTTASTTVATTTSGTTTSGTTPSGGGGGGSSTSGGGTTAPTPQPTKYAIVHLTVRFGNAAGTLRTYHDVARLTALPSASSPVAIFLGMRKDLKTAVFMLSTDVHAQGDGRCTPSRGDCEAVELKEGQTELLDVAANDGKVTHDELDLVKVTIDWTTSKSQAEAAYARASHAGLKVVLQRAATSVVASGLRYAPEQGVLLSVPTPFLSATPAPAGAPDGGDPGATSSQAATSLRRDGWVAVPLP